MIYSVDRYMRERAGYNIIRFAGPRCEHMGDAIARRVYRALRRSGMPAWQARMLVWRLAFDARTGEFDREVAP